MKSQLGEVVYSTDSVGNEPLYGLALIGSFSRSLYILISILICSSREIEIFSDGLTSVKLIWS